MFFFPPITLRTRCTTPIDIIKDAFSIHTTRPAAVNRVSLSHQHDVTSPVNTPDRGMWQSQPALHGLGDLAVCNRQERFALLSAPAEEEGWVGRGGFRLGHSCRRVTAGKTSAAAPRSCSSGGVGGGGVFTMFPRCNFRR